MTEYFRVNIITRNDAIVRLSSENLETLFKMDNIEGVKKSKNNLDITLLLLQIILMIIG